MINFIKRLFDKSPEALLHGGLAGRKFYDGEYRNVVIKGN